MAGSNFGMGVAIGRRERLQVVAETLDSRTNFRVVEQAEAIVERL